MKQEVMTIYGKSNQTRLRFGLNESNAVSLPGACGNPSPPERKSSDGDI